MIVVAIIAVLATIAIPTYKDYTIKSNVVATLSEASSYKTAVGLCYQENGGLS
ncbi:MAG TPA: prepilin-type cleavage/methylation domain-containing protein, partial [Vibrio sp.]|nr:prepilin-type cleavage/methylation domain-containing protein [Vibrio sp.]